MSAQMDPADEFPHRHPGTPNWTESFMFQAYSPGTRIGCFFHVGRASWGDPDLWLERLTVTLPDGRAAVSGAYRKGHREHGGGTDACYADCLEPYAAWTVVFDAAVQLTNLREMLDGRLRMGVQQPLHMELRWRPIGPIWDQRDMKIHSLKSVHYEQAGWLSGFVGVDGVRLPFEGPGRRDRSWGIRNFAALEEHTILHGEFPDDGIAFATAWFRVSDGPATPPRGYVAFGPSIEDITAATLPTTALFSPAGSPFEAVLPTHRGDLRIQGRVLQSFVHTLLNPNGVAVGADLEDDRAVILCGFQVELEADGRNGFGFMERSGKAPSVRAAAARARTASDK